MVEHEYGVQVSTVRERERESTQRHTHQRWKVSGGGKDCSNGGKRFPKEDTWRL